MDALTFFVGFVSGLIAAGLWRAMVAALRRRT